jgi:hypothetical protein
MSDFLASANVLSVVFFRQHQLLYASDTLALNADGSLYDPELMREVIDVVKREPRTQVSASVEKTLL